MNGNDVAIVAMLCITVLVVVGIAYKMLGKGGGDER